jgi:hypothetical protein
MTVKTSVGIQWDCWIVLELWIKKDRRSVDHLIFSHGGCVRSDRVSQLYTATLDNTGNNNTTCKTIEDIHVRRGLKWNSNEQQLPYVFFESHRTNYLNLPAVALGTLSILEMSPLCPTLRKSQLLKMQRLSGNTTPRETTTEF